MISREAALPGSKVLRDLGICGALYQAAGATKDASLRLCVAEVLNDDVQDMTVKTLYTILVFVMGHLNRVDLQ